MPKKLILDFNIDENDIQQLNNMLHKIELDKYYPMPNEVHKLTNIDENGFDINANINMLSYNNNNKETNDNLLLEDNYKSYKYITGGIENEVNIFKYKVNQVKISKNDMNIIELINYIDFNSVCWWCCHKINISETSNIIPVPCPIKYNENLQLFDCIGTFCSFNCCLSYAMNYKKNITYLVWYLYKKCVTTPFDMNFKFEKAPPREILQMFGGILNIEQYRGTFCKNSLTSFNINNYPVLYINQEIIEHKKTKFITNYDGILYNSNNKNIVGNNNIEENHKVSNKNNKSNKCNENINVKKTKIKKIVKDVKSHGSILDLLN